MSEDVKKAVEIDAIEVDPLTDEDLDSVAGGATRSDCSCTDTTGSCTGTSPVQGVE